jgi:hypothetical protein
LTGRPTRIIPPKRSKRGHSVAPLRPRAFLLPFDDEYAAFDLATLHVLGTSRRHVQTVLASSDMSVGDQWRNADLAAPGLFDLVNASRRRRRTVTNRR